MSVYSPGSGELTLRRTGRAFGLSFKSSGIPTASRCSKSTGRESIDAERSGTSPIGTMGQLPLFPAGHRASRLVLPGSVEAEKMTAGSGRSLLASLSAFYRSGCWQRILLESLVLKTGWRSRNGLLAWKLKTMRSSHRLFIQLQHSAPTTGDIESSLLPTLMESDGDSAGGPNANHLMLNRIARHGLLPTLMARDGRVYGQARSAFQADKNILVRAAGGTLDPVFCEWYMGFEDGWTDVE